MKTNVSVEWLVKKGFRPDGQGGYTKESPGTGQQVEPVDAGLSRSKLERAHADALEAASKVQEGGAGSPPIRVRITRLSRRYLDADNLAASQKFVIDAIRGEGYIPDDNPESVALEFRQRKVNRKDQEGTLIEIEHTKKGSL